MEYKMEMLINWMNDCFRHYSAEIEAEERMSVFCFSSEMDRAYHMSTYRACKAQAFTAQGQALVMGLCLANDPHIDELEVVCSKLIADKAKELRG